MILNDITQCSLFVRIGLEYSESRAMYNHTHKNMKKWIRIMDFAFFMVTPVVCISPTMIMSFITYFTTDLGESAFKLAIPMW